MSTALASARRRRAGPEAVAPPPGVRQTTPQPSFAGQPNQQQRSQPNMTPVLTLPQVIALVDKRLNTLEYFMQSSSQTQSQTVNENNNEDVEQIRSVIEEYNARFDMIADELSSLKDTIMKLQTYTMEVNKTLLQDRIRILSDEPSPSPLEEALNAYTDIKNPLLNLF
jgi:hypothetical protein